MSCSAVRHPNYGNTGCRAFKGGPSRGTKLEIFLHNNQHIQRKLFNRICVVGRCQKVSKFDFQSQFSMSKIIGIFLNFCLIENYQGAHFFVIDTF